MWRDAVVSRLQTERRAVSCAWEFLLLMPTFRWQLHTNAVCFVSDFQPCPMLLSLAGLLCFCTARRTQAGPCLSTRNTWAMMYDLGYSMSGEHLWRRTTEVTIFCWAIGIIRGAGNARSFLRRPGMQKNHDRFQRFHIAE